MMSKTPSFGLVWEQAARGGAPALVLRIGIYYGFGGWIKANGELPAQELGRNISALLWYKRDLWRGDS